MQFQTPTTKSEMMETLNDIYEYYHFRQLQYDGIIPEQLNITRLTFQTLNSDQLEAKARLLLSPEQDRERKTATDKIAEKITSLTVKLAESFVTEETLVLKLNETYDEAIKKAKNEIRSTKASDSSIAQEKIKEIERIRAEEIAKVRTSEASLRSELSAKIEAAEEELSAMDDYFDELHEKDVQKKVSELADEQDKMFREVKKYNNSLDEKELRYRNTLKSSAANLELRYLSIHEQGFNHDELVEMGYYNDVIDCVSGYYNSLTAEAAYLDIKNEERLVIYLDDYYSMLVQTYKIRSAQS